MNKFLKNYMEFREKNNFKNLQEYEKLHISQEQFKKVVKKDGNFIRYIDNPTKDDLLVAVQQNGHAIDFVFKKGIKPAEDVQLAAVQKNGGAISSILKNKIKPSEAVQLAAVKQYGDAIKYITDNKIKPSEDVQLAAVTQNGFAILHLINNYIPLSEKVQLMAVNKKPVVFKAIKEPYPSVIKLYKELTNK